MADTVNIKTSPDKVELAKGLVKVLMGRITEDEFIAFARVLGYTPNPKDPVGFIHFACDQTLTMLS